MVIQALKYKKKRNIEDFITNTQNVIYKRRGKT